jgi:hypothetical protein
MPKNCKITDAVLSAWLSNDGRIQACSFSLRSPINGNFMGRGAVGFWVETPFDEVMS